MINADTQHLATKNLNNASQNVLETFLIT